MERPEEHGLPEMNLFDAILHRRTCKAFTSEPVEFEKVAQVLEAGMHAPSSGNLQNWQFIVVTEKPKIRELYHHTLEQDVFNTAPLAIIVCSDDDTAHKYYGLRGKRLYSVQNCAACIQNMLLSAHAFGLGGCWVGAFDEEKVDSMFNIPQHIRAQAIILLGYSDEEPGHKDVKDSSFVTFFNEHGTKVAKEHLVIRDVSVEWEHQIAEMKDAWARKREENKGQLAEKGKEAAQKSKEVIDKSKEKLTKAYKSLKKE